jgi:hypothetical protein
VCFTSDTGETETVLDGDEQAYSPSGDDDLDLEEQGSNIVGCASRS